MATYYKGKIVIIDNDCIDKFSILFSSYRKDNEKVLQIGNIFIKNLEFFSNSEEKILKEYVLSLDKGTKPTVCTDKNIIEIMENKFGSLFQSNVLKKLKFVDIIYELVVDENGNYYGREILTNQIFPIFSFDKNLINDYFVTSSYRDFSDPYCGYGKEKQIYFNIHRTLNFSNMLRVGSMIFQQGYANKRELDDYLNSVRGIFKLVQRKVIIGKINQIGDLNVFLEDVTYQEVSPKKDNTENKQVVREKQNKITAAMEAIEYLLSILKTSNKDLYIQYKKEYENLLQNKDLTYHPLVMLEGKIEFSLSFQGKEADDIIEYLTNLTKETLSNLLLNSEKKTELTFEKINKINELFLKVKDKYDFVNQREVLKRLAFLYIMEIYENKEIITIDQLENSYFADNLKSIVICIKSLQELGLINCNYLIDIVEELSCKIVFDMIKNIEFRDLQEEQVKELVKSF